MIEAKISNNRSISIKVGDIEFAITTKVAKIDAMEATLLKLNATCNGSYKYELTKQQCNEFFKKCNILL